MDESTFETFEEELRTTQQDAPHTKHLRQARRPEMYLQRRVKEEPPIIQLSPKSPPCEAPFSKATPRQKSVSIQNVAQIDAPWEGVTLNRCLVIVITILVLTSGCQRVHEFLRGCKDETDIEPIGTMLNVRHTAMRKYRLPAPEPETSLWDTLYWWVNDEDEEGSSRSKAKKITQEKATRGLRHKAIPGKQLLKRREETFKTRRNKARQAKEKSRGSVKSQREKVKRFIKKKLEEMEEEKEMMVKNTMKESK